jgi:hypothetical protein
MDEEFTRRFRDPRFMCKRFLNKKCCCFPKRIFGKEYCEINDQFDAAALKSEEDLSITNLLR